MAEKCPRCKEKISKNDVVVECPNCKKQYHKWCWGFVEKCGFCGAPNDETAMKVYREKQKIEQEESKRRRQEADAKRLAEEDKRGIVEQACQETINPPQEMVEKYKKMPTIPYFEKNNKRESHNKGNIISGIVFILFGVIILGMNTGVYGSSHIEFGGDFYTEIYNELTNVLDNLVRIGNILKYGFGFLLIGLGVDRLTKK